MHNESLVSYSENKSARIATAAQTHADSAIHRWYRLRLGFSDHLVAELLEQLQVAPNQTVLDPFCGAGTTLVECKKKSINSIGVDANPSSCFASEVKTKWHLSARRIASLLDELEALFVAQRLDAKILIQDPTVCYLRDAGLLKRGWICDQPLLESIALKQCIWSLKTTTDYRNFMMLGLVAEVIEGVSNVKFGPELYCGPRRGNVEVFDGFAERVSSMMEDLVTVTKTKATVAIYQNDSRNLSDFVREEVHAIISSPPYPAEHDYTRNTRLELAFLEQVQHKQDLRDIKKSMVRCNTKGIYLTDSDEILIEKNKSIAGIVDAINKKTKTKKHGFARLYSKVVKEYFGGMHRHMLSAYSVLKPGGRCAFVVGDQSAYVRVHIPTAEILADIAKTVGFKCIGIRRWRTRWSSTTKKSLDENVLILKKEAAKP